MKYVLLCLALTGCATNNEIAMKMLGNLEHCDRQYTLGIGAGAAGSMVVQCKAMPYSQP